MPELARTNSPLEVRFLLLCEQHGLPRPEVNVKVAGFRVDCLWRDAGVIVELDGQAGHGYEAAVERDRARDLTLRAAGYRVLRYSWWQITSDQGRVVADLRRELAGEPN
jgi:very-short-patch-repair endonuclease